MRHTAPALDASGDTHEVTGLFHRLLQCGTGAARTGSARPSPKAASR
ncbi:hypothetical protein AB0D71_23450 [Streptomyces avermitilis]